MNRLLRICLASLLGAALGGTAIVIVLAPGLIAAAGCC